MKKLMLLGGSRYLIPVIKKAHEIGLYVITCDNIPGNSAHFTSDQYINVSVIEKDDILRVAMENEIDGIMSFACDPGVVTAAYVAEKLRLPFQCSYESACILQDKGKFRQFLIENEFNSPAAKSYKSLEDACNDINSFRFPIIIKPTDSAGSKGVTRIDSISELPNAVEKALNFSLSGSFIIEEFLVFDGYHSSTDVFTVNGDIRFITYSDQLFDTKADNPYTPAYIIWPSTMKETHQDYLTKEIQRLFCLLDMKTGIYNIETCVSNGIPYIMEVSPRGGGCKIAEIQELAYGVDLIEAEITSAIGEPIGDLKHHNCDGHWIEMVIHAKQRESGYFKSISINETIKKNNLQVVDLSVKQGDYVRPFTGANMSLGDLFFRFNSRDELNEALKNQENWLNIELDKEEYT